jgi:hypothetical protein
LQSFTAKNTKDAEERNSLTAKHAKAAKKSIIKTERARRNCAKVGIGRAMGMPTPETAGPTHYDSTGYGSNKGPPCMPPLAQFLGDLFGFAVALIIVVPFAVRPFFLRVPNKISENAVHGSTGSPRTALKMTVRPEFVEG